MYQRTRTRVEGFVVGDYEHRFDDIGRRLRNWVRENELRYRESIANGIEQAPNAFLGLFDGVNIGKQLVTMTEEGDKTRGIK
jgi:NADPH-dependent curcumin reductase CurA